MPVHWSEGGGLHGDSICFFIYTIKYHCTLSPTTLVNATPNFDVEIAQNSQYTILKKY
jgi:hypothetical protein